MPKANGYILYEGPSLIDGAPIVVIATGFTSPSRNPKTGDMIQTWILRADIKPMEALRTGADISICGDCSKRPDPVTGKRDCYVMVHYAPTSVFGGYTRGIYPRVSLTDLQTLCAGRMIRFGAYGDPAAAPIAIWEAMARDAKGWTGYSHQWRKLGTDWQRLLMASADSEADARDAWAHNWRTFRVTSEAFDTIRGKETVCPASKEKGAVTDCATCRACMGLASKARVSIAIAAH